MAAAIAPQSAWEHVQSAYPSGSLDHLSDCLLAHPQEERTTRTHPHQTRRIDRFEAPTAGLHAAQSTASFHPPKVQRTAQGPSDSHTHHQSLVRCSELLHPCLRSGSSPHGRCPKQPADTCRFLKSGARRSEQTAAVSTWVLPLRLLRLLQRAARAGEIDVVAGIEARIDLIELLTVRGAFGGGDSSCGIDLARVVHRAGCAGFVAGVVDSDHCARLKVDDRRSRSSADRLAARLGKAYRVTERPGSFP